MYSIRKEGINKDDPSLHEEWIKNNLILSRLSTAYCLSSEHFPQINRIGIQMSQEVVE